MNGNELQNLKDHMVDLIEGSDKLTKVQFEYVNKELKENKEATEKIGVKFDEYLLNHYAFHKRWNKKTMKWIVGSSMITIILILSGAAGSLISYAAQIFKIVF